MAHTATAVICSKMLKGFESVRRVYFIKLDALVDLYLVC